MPHPVKIPHPVNIIPLTEDRLKGDGIHVVFQNLNNVCAAFGKKTPGEKRRKVPDEKRREAFAEYVPDEKRRKALAKYVHDKFKGHDVICLAEVRCDAFAVDLRKKFNPPLKKDWTVERYGELGRHGFVVLFNTARVKVEDFRMVEPFRMLKFTVQLKAESAIGEVKLVMVHGPAIKREDKDAFKTLLEQECRTDDTIIFGDFNREDMRSTVSDWKKTSVRAGGRASAPIRSENTQTSEGSLGEKKCKEGRALEKALDYVLSTRTGVTAGHDAKLPCRNDNTFFSDHVAIWFTIGEKSAVASPSKGTGSWRRNPRLGRGGLGGRGGRYERDGRGGSYERDGRGGSYGRGGRDKNWRQLAPRPTFQIKIRI